MEASQAKRLTHAGKHLCMTACFLTVLLACNSHNSHTKFSDELLVYMVGQRYLKIGCFLDHARDYNDNRYPTEVNEDGLYTMPKALMLLQTPYAKYLSTYSGIHSREAFFDPFSNKGEGNGFFQYVSNGNWYCLFSCGPDQVYEEKLIADLHENRTTTSENQARARISSVMYDPTNGTLSSGDIVDIRAWK